ncbi:MAG: nuclease A inhibitor family protein [Bacteroidota bacterium]
MNTISLKDIWKTLDLTQASLLAASNDDGLISRVDLQRAIENESSPSRQALLRQLYSFLLKREENPRGRITEKDLKAGINFIKEQLIPHFEIELDFSPQTRHTLQQLAPMAYPLSNQLLRTTEEHIYLSTEEVASQIGQYTEKLLFDDFGSEAGIAISAFYHEAEVEILTMESFAKALSLDVSTPREEIARFEEAYEPLLNFIDLHAYFGLEDQAQAIVELMQMHLTQLSVIIIGQDNHPDLSSEHPTYVIGVGDDGDLAGFQTKVIWT